MTTELFWLTLSALLASSLWIPYIIGASTEPKDYSDFTLPVPKSGMRPWVQRADRAHMNMLETLLPFAAVVIVAHLTGISTSVTVWASIAFFALRVVHAVGMITGTTLFPLRSAVFTLSWLCTVTIGVVVLLG